MVRFLLGGSALIVIAAGAPSFAQDAPPPPPPPGAEMHHGMHGRMAMAAMPAMPPLTRADAEKRVAEQFAMLDLNHDGVLTRDEIARARREHGPEAMRKEFRDKEFAALDKDKNGSLSREEFEAPRPLPHMAATDGPPPAGHPMIRQIVIHRMRGPGGDMMGDAWFDRADANKDDKVTLAEAKTSVLAMFDRADLNHDGTITPDERRAAFRRMRHGPGMMPGGPGMMPPPPAAG